MQISIESVEEGDQYHVSAVASYLLLFKQSSIFFCRREKDNCTECRSFIDLNTFLLKIALS